MTSRLLTLMGSRINYLLRAEFNTAQAAPIGATIACEVGGPLTVTDTENKLSISGGNLVCAGGKTVPAWGDPGAVSAVGFARVAGRSAVWEFVPTTGVWEMYLYQSATSTDPTSAQLGLYVITAAAFQIRANGIAAFTIGTYTAGVRYKLWLVSRSVGGFYVIQGGLQYPTPTLLWPSVAGNASNLFPGIPVYSGQFTADYLRARDLPGAWASDYGIATSRTASAGVGATGTMIADALIEATWTAVTGETYELSVRRTDDDNRWKVVGTQAASTVELVEVDGGGEVVRSSAAQTWTNGTGYRIVVVADGATINTFVANVAKNAYALAATGLTATGVKTSHAVTDLVAWPRTVTIPNT